MDAEHTPGPLSYSFPRLDGKEIRDADCQIDAGGALIANVSHGPIFPMEPFGSRVREANARRLVACWNACDGISTEALEVPGIIQKRIESACGDLYEVKRERDALLAFAQSLIDAWESPEGIPYPCNIANAAHAAIAKATGVQS